jgi:hypothetical protein
VERSNIAEYSDKTMASLDVSLLSISLYDRYEGNGSQSDTTALLNKLEQQLIEREQHTVTRSHWLAISSSILEDKYKVQGVLERKTSDFEKQVGFHVQAVKNLLQYAHNNRDEAVILRKALYDCAEELVLESDSNKYKEVQSEREEEEVIRRDAAARVIQKHFRKIQKRMQMREAIQMAAKLNKTNKKHQKKLEQYQQLMDQTSANTGVMLMRRSFDEIEYIFSILNTYFLHDENDADNARKMAGIDGSPVRKIRIPSDAEAGSERLATPPSPSSSFSNLQKYNNKRHSSSSSDLNKMLGLVKKDSSRFSLRMSPNK